jgi:glycosyltransferase involved in cell wall biosynthesis
VAFSRIFTEFGFEPVALAPARAAAALPFDRLLAERPLYSLAGPQDDLPLISVIMAAFNPGPELLASVRSVINQSWSNWELLLVDDCSGPEYRSMFEQCRALDPRIRLLVNEQNIGTYRTRNDTLDLANGEFVTIQDADDWMHPRRLELQARHLLENPTEIANVSYSLRVSDHLLFAQDRGYDVMLCEPAILFRRVKALATVGYFDGVRAGADTEYRSRLGVAQGHPVVTLSMLPPLTLQRFSVGSLSGSDISPGWLHPARVAYRSAWAQWHASTMSDGQVPFLPKAQDERRFPAPARLSGVRLPAPQKYDLLFALDFVGRADSRNELASVRAELEAFVSAGKRMAVLHLWAFGAAPAPDFRQAEAIQQLINDGTIDQVFIDDEIIVDRLVVRTPEVLQFPPPWPSTIRPASTRIMRPRDPALIVERDCEINAEALFGRTATWISSGELRRIAIEKS